MVASAFRPEVEIRPFRACAMHPAIIIETVRSLWTWLLGRYHVPQNVFLVGHIFTAHAQKRSFLAATILFLCNAGLIHSANRSPLQSLMLSERRLLVSLTQRYDRDGTFSVTNFNLFFVR